MGIKRNWLVLLTIFFLILSLSLNTDAIQNRIAHGPILGRPGTTSMGVWARTFQPGSFRVIYGTRKEKLNRKTDPVVTTLKCDNAGWVLLDDLAPDTPYYYSVVIDDEKPHSTVSGSFRTLPDPDQYRSVGRNPDGLFNFSFEIGCGNLLSKYRSADPQMKIFDVALNKLKDKIHFAIQTGDFIYEDNDARVMEPGQWISEMGLRPGDIPAVIKTAPRVVGVWENYKRYFEKCPSLTRWHRNIPSLFMLDDHEILNDVMGTGEIGYRHRAACFRDIGVKAWNDYLGWANPVDFSQPILFGKADFERGSGILIDDEADFTSLDLEQAASLIVHWGRRDDGVLNPRLDKEIASGNFNAGVYHVESIIDKHKLRIKPPAVHDDDGAYSIGRRNYFKVRFSNVEFFFVDTRSHRGLPAMGFEHVPGQTMLGIKQKGWLKTAMQNSDADFLLVISSVNLMIPHVGKGDFIHTNLRTDEAWTGFMAEREELITFWETLNKPVLIFSGDLHNSFSVKISDQIWEFGAAPHNSSNHNLKSEGNRPKNGKYTSGNRECQIRWSTFFLDDTAPFMRKQPVFTVVKVNNVFNNPQGNSAPSWVAYPHPQIIVQFFNGYNGDLLYSESVVKGL